MKSKFLTFILKYAENSGTDYHFYIMLKHFIEMIDDEHFDIIINRMIKFKNFDNAFVDFHKSMRQTDFYNIGEKSGNLDMLFWNFIGITEVPYNMFHYFIHDIHSDETLLEN